MTSRREEVDLLVWLLLDLLHLVLVLAAVLFVQCICVIHDWQLVGRDTSLFFLVTPLFLHLCVAALNLLLWQAPLSGSRGYRLALSETERTVTAVVRPISLDRLPLDVLILNERL